METTYRHPVGKQTLAGYIEVRPRSKSFFGAEPGLDGRQIEIRFGEGQKVAARYYRTSGKSHRLKIAYTGESGERFRSFLRKAFKMRKVRKPRGVLVFTRTGADLYMVQPESIQQATVEVLEVGPHRYFEGARPISVLHPAMIDLPDRIQSVSFRNTITIRKARGLMRRALTAGGWEEVPAIGSGLALSGGLRRSGAQLHEVLEAPDLYPALLSLAASFELGSIDLGVLLIADGNLASRLKVQDGGPSASLDRAVRNIRQLGFMIRGPICAIALNLRKTLR